MGKEARWRARGARQRAAVRLIAAGRVLQAEAEAELLAKAAAGRMTAESARFVLAQGERVSPVLRQTAERVLAAHEEG